MQKIFRRDSGTPRANEGRPPRPAEKSHPLATENLNPAENNLIPAEKKI